MPASLVKAVLTALDRINLPLMDPEQYLIADEVCILDTSKAKRELGWQPRYKDDDMLLAAYREYSRGTASGAGHTPATIGDADVSTLHDTGVIDGMPTFDGASLRMTRRTDAGVQLVVWSLRDGIWQRWASRPVVRQAELLELWMSSYQFLGNEAGTVRALPGVAQWQVYYWRNNAWSNPQSTGDVATPGRGAQNPRPAAGSKQRLPEGIRVVLTMAPGSGLNGSITRDFVLRTRSE